MIKAIVVFISVFSVYFPAVSGLIKWRLLNKELKFLAVFYLIASASETWSYCLAVSNKNNLFISHIYCVVEFSAYTIFIAMISSFFHRIRWIILLSIPMFVLYSIYYGSVISSVFKYNSYPLAIESLWMILLSGLILLRQIGNDEFEMRNIKPEIQIVMGIFIYFVGSFFVLMSYGLQNLTLGRYIGFWLLHPIVNTMGNVIFGLSFVRCKTLIQK